MNMDATPDFDPLRFPLRGRSLIEASAGTGKTWTIALLYLRLALGHGAAEVAFPRPLAPAEILVMTFTDAATQELRERIRQRLAQAARVFAGEVDPPDPALASLRAAYPPADWPARAAQLRLAAESMDDAAIHTLHAWAGRVLREHALSSGSPLDETIAPDDGPDLHRQALHDHWRRAFYPLATDAARVARLCFAGPDALWRAVHPLLNLPADAPLRYQGEALDGAQEALEALQNQQRHVDDLQALARRLWREDRAALEALWHRIRPDLHGNSYPKKDDAAFAGRLAELAAWSEGADAPDNIARFSASGAKLTKGKTLPDHPAHAALDDWLVARDAMAGDLAALKARLAARAARAVREETARLRTQRAELGFDDLLTRLDGALAGPGGPALAARLRAQYPVALVDEFQDTDPVQYRILRRIYGAAQDDAAAATGDCALILIGDPKQAIYAFRGADIHTYLGARADVLAARGVNASLGTNYRSTGELVAAVNHLFTRAAARPQGAFGFRRADDDPVPFAPVDARGRGERLWIDGQPAAALTLWDLAPDDDRACVGIKPYRQHMAQVFATQVAHWLSHTAADDPRRCGFLGAHGQWRPLRPRDIAVLVRSGAEAEIIRTPLQQRGVQSVYLSERSSVFASTEARDVATWLAALADPADEVALRAALATSTLDLSLSELERLASDDLAWEDASRRWRELRGRWQRQGVLPMLHALLGAHGLPARLLGQPGGERRLTNVLHLAEWLQTRALALDGPQALLRALRTRLLEPTEGGAENLLRLEGDGERLKVVTFHKSKGLEYPLVLLPFAAAWRDESRASSGGGPAVFHDEAARARVAEWGDAPEASERASAERQAEDMRLLYVALTRARHALWLGVAPLAARSNAKNPQLDNGALGQILGQGQPIASLAAYRQALAETCAGQAASVIALADAPAPDDQRWRAPAPPALHPARTFRHGGFAPWWIASYTALTRRVGALPEDGAPDVGAGRFYDAAQEWALEADAAEAASASGNLPDAHPDALPDVRHAFPRGAEAGTVLHGLLQWCAQQGFARVRARPAGLRDQAARRLAARGWSHWVDPLCDWLIDLLDKPLALSNEEQPLCLSRLENALGEMEFWLPARHLDVARLDALVTAHIWPGEPRPPLAPGVLAGLVKGYIDLSFAHAGRYWVADYKSHWLGPDAAAYQAPALRATMLAHRYDVQAALYLLALYRLLRTRLPAGEDIMPHLGGAAYCFLRGIGAEGQGLVTISAPRELMLALDAALTEGAP